MIAITDKTRFAVLALTELAQRAGGPVPIQDISDSRGIPLHVLEQLFASLRRAGILQSQRGVKGGYSFRRSPVGVTLLDVVETVDGRWEQGPEGGTTVADAVLNEARERLAAMLTDVTILDMVDRESRARQAPMFHI